jgi:ferrous iron transport protein B
MSSVPSTTPRPLERGASASGAEQGGLVLVGNPNVGKSVLFGLLTGRYVTVSNYPGTTVAVSRGRATIAGADLEVLDTPGVNSLLPMSEDEQVTRDILVRRHGAAVVLVADAKNLRRGLLVAVQLAEMGLPFVLALNMTDEADALGLHVDREGLERALGVPVVRTVAVRRKGLDELQRAIVERRRATLAVSYPPAIEEALAATEPLLPDTAASRRALALQVLCGDDTVDALLRDRVSDADRLRLEEIRRGAAGRMREPLRRVVAQARLAAVDEVLRAVETRPRARRDGLLAMIGRFAMHPVWGLPILALVLWVTYQFVGVFGAGTSVDFLESKVFGGWVSPAAIHAVDALLPFPHEHAVEEGAVVGDHEYDRSSLSAWQRVARFLHDLLVGPYGQVTVALSYAIALILPIVATFFLAFGLLEDSGYLPRLAVMVNRAFRTMGLNGKAVLPMVLGLGCDTMATLTTRILETRKERILTTLLLALAVPCSAQLGVILGMMRALSLGATLVWAGTILLTLLAVGWLAAKLVPGERSDFILELPPIRLPQLRNIVVKTLARIEWYLREAVPLFLLGTLVLFVLHEIRLLGVLEAAASPVVHGVLGLPPQTAEAFLVGFLRRDYGAAGLYDMARDGLLNPVQLVVAMVTITLFVPCVANFFIMIKERGVRTALLMVAFIVPIAFVVGGSLRFLLAALGVTFQ